MNFVSNYNGRYHIKSINPYCGLFLRSCFRFRSALFHRRLSSRFRFFLNRSFFRCLFSFFCCFSFFGLFRSYREGIMFTLAHDKIAKDVVHDAHTMFKFVRAVAVLGLKLNAFSFWIS